MAQCFTRTGAPATSPRDLERRLAAGVRFLQTEQISPASARAGAWPAVVIRKNDAKLDWNAFNTAMTSAACAAIADETVTHETAALQRGAATFLRSCSAPEPEGSYRFWPVEDYLRPGPDLDDTALVHIALLAAGNDPGFDSIECLRLFGPYRMTSGCPPHPLSAWASGFAGVFGTWMNSSDPIVDVCANANVVRLLQKCGATENAGYRAAVTMLSKFVKLRTLPTDVSPYYRSSSMLAWLCAQLELQPDTSRPEEIALAAALRARLAEEPRPGTLFEDLILTLSARQTLGLAPSTDAITRLIELQTNDGGWPPITMCWNFAGTLRWIARAFPSALALGLLCNALRGNTTC